MSNIDALNISNLSLLFLFFHLLNKHHKYCFMPGMPDTGTLVCILPLVLENITAK